MPATLTVKQNWTDGKRLHVVGTLTLTGSYVTGGIPLSLLVDGVFTSQPIVCSNIIGKGGYYGYDIGTLYQYRYQAAPSTQGPQGSLFLSQGLLRIFLGSAEISAGAFPAGVLSDVIDFYGIFQKY